MTDDEKFAVMVLAGYALALVGAWVLVALTGGL